MLSGCNVLVAEILPSYDTQQGQSLVGDEKTPRVSEEEKFDSLSGPAYI